MLALTQGDCQHCSRKSPTNREQDRDGAAPGPFKAAAGKNFIIPEPDTHVRVKTARRVRGGIATGESSTFGDPRRTVRYLTFIYDKVSLDRP
ncbi:hypothetical protein G6F46_013618 [Rhizopus delemar]|nr:hypothetical protein G6F46_013618 [Rhizopus delemar]